MYSTAKQNNYKNFSKKDAIIQIQKIYFDFPIDENDSLNSKNEKTISINKTDSFNLENKKDISINKTDNFNLQNKKTNSINKTDSFNIIIFHNKKIFEFIFISILIR